MLYLIFCKDIIKNYFCVASEKTVFNATIIVAGTNKTSNALKIADTIFPISMPRIAASRTRPWMPAKLTITKETEARRKVCASYSETKYPTIKPKTARIPKTKEFLCSAKTPINTAMIIPIKKAHALIKFSLALIGILFICLFICFLIVLHLLKAFS